MISTHASRWRAAVVTGALLASGAVVMVAGGAAPAGASTATGQPVSYPDLGTLPPRDLRFATVNTSAEPGQSVMRKVLQFSNTVVNSGQGPLEIRSTVDQRLSPPGGAATQRVYDQGGGYVDVPAGRVEYHAVHDHYHYDGWGEYQLWTAADHAAWLAAGRPAGAKPMLGAKTTSCVLDEEFVSTLPGTPAAPPYGSAGCRLDAEGKLRGGLSVGWGDTYDWYRFENWVVLGGESASLADGDYVLRSVTDPGNQLHESPGGTDASREGAVDNEGVTAFRVSGGTIVDSAPPTGTLSLDGVSPRTTSTDVTAAVIGRDDVSGVDSFRLSNDGVSWRTWGYTDLGSKPNNVTWSLSDERYGGSSATGLRTVHLQLRDRAGVWGPTTTDTIELGSPPTSGYGAVVVPDSPVGFWRLGEGSSAGAAALDVTGAHPGTYTGTLTRGATGLVGSDSDTAVRIPGSSGHVRIADSAALSPEQLTVEAWIRPDVIPAAGQFASILSKLESYALQFNGPRLEFTVIQAGARKRLQAPPGAVAAGATSHVVGTFDGVTQRLYLNGALIASAALSGRPTATSNPLTLGSWDGTREFLTGTLDEVAVYSRALSAARVQAHYDTGAPTSTTSYPVTVTVSGSGSGTVTSNPAGISCPGTCSSTAPASSTVTLTATPTSGSSFTGWTGACTGTNPTCTFSAYAATSAGATFEPATTAHSLTVTLGGSGSGSVTSSPAGISCPPTCVASYPSGQAVVLTAAPAAGSQFLGWAGACANSSGTCTTTVDQAKSVSATFQTTARHAVTVGLSGTGSGTVTSSPSGISCSPTCSTSVTAGTTVVLTATASSGSSFTGWSGACSGSGSTCSTTVQAPVSATATFTLTPPPPPAGDYRSVVAADAPVGHWRLGEATGTTAADATGSHPGTYTGALGRGVPGLLPSDPDRATRVPGSGHVRIAHTAALSPTRVTLEAWVRPEALPASGGFASVASKLRSYALQLNGARMEFVVFQGSTRKRLQAPAGAVPAGATSHVVGTFDGTTQRLYVNGAQVAAAAVSGTITATTAPLTLGSWDGTTEFLTGTLDEVAVYPVALSAARIAAHHATGTRS